MATPTWDNTEPVAAPKWEDTTEVKATSAAPASEPGWFQPGSQSEAIVRGASQGATLGFGDEIQAGIRSVTGQQPGESILDAYRRLRDEQRAANSSSAQANPITYNVAQAAGSLPSTLVTPTTGVAKGLGFNAIHGALAGAGNSDADATTLNGAQEMAKDAATGGAITAAAGGVGQVVGKGLQGTANVAKSLTDRAAGNVMAKSADSFESSLGKAIQKDPSLIDHVKPTYLNDVLPSAGHTAKAVLGTVVDGVKNIDKKDILAAGLGALTAGPLGALNAVVGKRVLVDKTGEAVISHINEIGSAARPMVTALQQKFAPIVNAAVQKGTPFAAINNILQQQSPEYREMIRAQEKLKEEDGQ